MKLSIPVLFMAQYNKRAFRGDDLGKYLYGLLYYVSPSEERPLLLFDVLIYLEHQGSTKTTKQGFGFGLMTKPMARV